jgi:hypothetical protein
LPTFDGVGPTASSPIFENVIKSGLDALDTVFPCEKGELPPQAKWDISGAKQKKEFRS